jgi:serine/threonine protein kinase
MHTASAIICQAARGLEHAHSRGLIHRDVKPGNLLVTPDGRCKVSDLGLAGYLHDEGESRHTVGTADYLSPEQITTPSKLTTTCDIYSLGCTLYYSVTGKVPFPGGTTREKARKHCYDQPIDPRRLNPDLDTDFVDVLADLMAKRPEERVPSAAAVIERLAPWAGDDWLVVSEARAAARRENRSLLESKFNALNDTKPLVIDDPDDRQESGVSSDGTLPVGMASEETLPFDSQTRFALPELGLPAAVWVAITLGVVAVLALLVVIIFQAMG